MALIKCSECGAEISDRALECPKCGCPIDITKKQIFDEKNNKKKKSLVIFLSLIVLLFIGITVGYFTYSNASPDKQAVKIIKKDLKKSITVNEIYYNNEIQGCLVKFEVDGGKDIAAVHLSDKTVGYSSVLDEYMEASNNAENDKEKEEIAQKFVEYTDLYDFMWFYNVYIDDPEENGWKKLE